MRSVCLRLQSNLPTFCDLIFEFVLQRIVMLISHYLQERLLDYNCHTMIGSADFTIWSGFLQSNQTSQSEFSMCNAEKELYWFGYSVLHSRQEVCITKVEIAYKLHKFLYNLRMGLLAVNINHTTTVTYTSWYIHASACVYWSRWLSKAVLYPSKITRKNFVYLDNKFTLVLY